MRYGPTTFYCLSIREYHHTKKRHMCYLHIYHNTSVILRWSVTITGESNRKSIMDSQGVPGSITSGSRQVPHKPTWVDVKTIMMNERDKMRYTEIYTTLIT